MEYIGHKVGTARSDLQVMPERYPWNSGSWYAFSLAKRLLAGPVSSSVWGTVFIPYYFRWLVKENTFFLANPMSMLVWQIIP
jgi:hypothetical protein